MQKSIQLSELNLLKEQIKYMRKKMMQAENAEKDLRLQFELYKANVESNQQEEVRASRIVTVVLKEEKKSQLSKMQDEL